MLAAIVYNSLITRKRRLSEGKLSGETQFQESWAPLLSGLCTWWGHGWPPPASLLIAEDGKPSVAPGRGQAGPPCSVEIQSPSRSGSPHPRRSLSCHSPGAPTPGSPRSALSLTLAWYLASLMELCDQNLPFILCNKNAPPSSKSLQVLSM